MSVKGTVVTYGSTLDDCRRSAAQAIAEFVGHADVSAEEDAEAVMTLSGEVVTWKLTTAWTA